MPFEPLTAEDFAAPPGTVTPETAQFLLNLLGQQTLQVGHPEFAATAATIQKAQQELTALLAHTTAPTPSEEQTT